MSDNIDFATSDFTSSVTFTDAYATASFRKFGSLVVFTYQGSRKTHTVGETTFTIPSDYRPATVQGSDNQYWFNATYDGITPATFYIRTTTGVGSPNVADSSSTRLYVSGCYFTD